MTLIESIRKAMLSHSGNVKTDSEYLIRLFNWISNEERYTLNLVFLSMCGVTLCTLIEKLEADFFNK